MKTSCRAYMLINWCALLNVTQFYCAGTKKLGKKIKQPQKHLQFREG